jgi:hypothetical protein
MHGPVPRPRWLLGALAASAPLLAASPAIALDLPATSLAYRIEVELDPATRGLKGTEEIRWKNETGEPVGVLPCHLYLNGFSHTKTTWMREAMGTRLEIEDLLARHPDPWGHSDLVSVRQRVEGGARDAAFHAIQPDDGNPLDRSLVQIDLPSPVPPGGEVVLEIQFDARLPVPIARTGGAHDYFFAAQWFPKIGVIEPPGVRHADSPRRAARQFHGPTEFYADFADYDVTISVPEGYLVGATGRAQGELASDGKGRARVRHVQRAVHDFAFVAGKSLAARTAHHAPAAGGPAVDVRYIIPAGLEHQIPPAQKAIEGALDVFGRRVGPYPYDVLTVVMMPSFAAATGGMEYPTLITGIPADPLFDVAPFDTFRMQENVLVHEFGHQYFYGLLASHEMDEAFLDEGFNSYWEIEVMHELYGTESSLGHFLGMPLRNADQRSFGLSHNVDTMREPLRKSPSWLFEPGTWGKQIYTRPALSLDTAARLHGRDRLERVFAEYFRRFAFHHPDAEDFLAVAAETGGPELVAFLREAFAEPRIPNHTVTEASTAPYLAPLGRVPTESGPAVITKDSRAKNPELGLPPEAREPDGRVLVEIIDPGFFRDAERRDGTVTRTLVTPERGAPSPSHHAGGFYETNVRIEGPGWDRLPATVALEFADGVVVRDGWDGRSGWRAYRVVRPAALTAVRVDPERKIVVDPKPQDNARAVEPDRKFAADWGLWMGAVAQWIAGGASLWL